MSLRGSVTAWQKTGFPRVSGDEPILHTAHEVKTAFSPRERG